MKTSSSHRTKSEAVAEGRASGILLHPTSLPGAHGCGDLGGPARAFVDFLAAARQRWWQMLPVVPAGAGNSPYSAPSAFAGSPLLVSLDVLAERGLLSRADLTPALPLREGSVDFGATRAFRFAALRNAFANFERVADAPLAADLRRYTRENRAWLDEYALFQALKDAHGGAPWSAWESPLRLRRPAALAKARATHAADIRFYQFVQWQFDSQWSVLRAYARARGVGLIGDVPIFVEHDSADVWAHREIFQLDAKGAPKAKAGVPPDYFSSTGQMWGNPLYRWDVLEKRGFDWWVDRIRHQMKRFDLLRLDHFIGFHRAWSLPGDAVTAIDGKWEKGPGAALFETLRRKLGGLPLIAEDLGLLIPEVKKLRDRFDLPGMKILQFAFGDDAEADNYKPHNYPRRSIVYTGTHDNDTTVGWFADAGSASSTRSPAQIRAEREHTLRYLVSDGREIHWDMIRAAMASVSDTAIFPLQDVLGLGSGHRMNRPGVAKGNWEWRFRDGELTPAIAERLRVLADTYGRGARA